VRGGLALHKTKGTSSFDVIRRLRPIIGEKTKIGHAGTLDPAAQGLLLILVDEATRVQNLLKDLDKEYEAVVRLGVRTDTLDAEGKVLEEAEVPVLDEKVIRDALDKLTGERMQAPPRYSALKVKGRRAYDMARKGEEFELPERRVTISEIELLSWKNPLLEIRTRVSAGTYIRSLAREIGEELGLPASLAALCRTRIGRFELKDSLPVDNITIQSIKEAMIPIEELLSHLPQAEISEQSALRLLQGKPLSGGIDPELLDAKYSVLFSTDRSKAFLCEPRQGMLWSKRLIYNDEVGNA
jgi:tRNA pseudouridine55 synthase